MKVILSLALILICSFAFGQKVSKDTLSVTANVIQLERLNAIQEKINSDQKQFSDLLELIFGVNMEDVEWWGFKNGKFYFITKKK